MENWNNFEFLNPEFLWLLALIPLLAIWFFFSIVVFMFGESLNSASFLGYPLAYYMTAQGSLLAFIILIFWMSGKQEDIDEEFGFGEREDD